MKKEENAMVYTTDYQSPLGTIFLAADEKGLTGLWLEGTEILCCPDKKMKNAGRKKRRY